MFVYLFPFRGKLVLGYSEIELVTTGSGYQFIHAADMMYCADNHLRSELSYKTHAPNTLISTTFYFSVLLLTVSVIFCVNYLLVFNLTSLSV